MVGNKLVAAGLLAAAVAGCTSAAGGTGPREGFGTVAGAVAGGVIGSTIGSGAGRVVATVAGATVGGLLGNAIGRSLDNEARAQAQAAEFNALEYGAPGAPVAWRHEVHYGTVTPGPYYVYRGYERCREYTHTIYINGRPETARGVACRNPEGTWGPVG